MNWKVINNYFIFNTKNISAEHYAILNNLTDNGLGYIENNNYVIPVDGIYELTTGQKKLLDLPQEYPYILKIDSEGLINTGSFRFIPIFALGANHGKFQIIKQEACIIHLRDRDNTEFTYLLEKNQYDVLSVILSLNITDINSTSDRYHAFALIKNQISNNHKIILNEYLNSINVISPNNLHIGLDYNNGTLELYPDLSNDILKETDISRGDFLKKFDNRNDILPVYTIKKNTNETFKVTIPKGAEKELKKFKESYRQINDKNIINDIIHNPSKYLDEETFDISEFYSDRVIEIGLYKPTFYGFISPYKSEWIPGIIIEDRYNGNTNIFLKDHGIIKEIESLIIEAEANGDDVIVYRGYNLNIGQLKETIKLAKEQNKEPQKLQRDKCVEKKVLIIEDNAESLGYTETIHNLDLPLEYTFHKIDHLKKDVQLKSHQVEGIAWLQHLAKNKFKGCLLADDMGLGKTLQVLCFIDWHKQYCNPNNKPYLVVAPVSLLENWSNEIHKFLMDGFYNPIILRSQSLKKDYDETTIQWLNQQDVIITNYETVRKIQFNICAVDFAAVILDESQKIKTPGTYITNAAKALKADFKIAMTGTPVENTFLDLWCIMDFVIPGLLGNAKEFEKKYQTPLSNPNTDIDKIGKEIREQMGISFLRRQKLDVLKDLPIKTEYKDKVVMSSEQEMYYRSVIMEAKGTDIEDSNNALNIIGKLRRISDSSLLAIPEIDIESYNTESLISTSGKIKHTLTILDNIKSKNEKVIIFCIYKDSQRILQKVISGIYGITPRIVNGDTKATRNSASKNYNNYTRQQAIDYFESVDGFNVIIMSPIAAGMGLNVTAANHVIHFGRHWNPAKESQATDRAYRIGQEKPVSVYYPITILNRDPKFKSFEELLDSLLQRKSNLATSTLYPSESTSVKLDDFKEFLHSINYDNY